MTKRELIIPPSSTKGLPPSSMPLGNALSHHQRYMKMKPPVLIRYDSSKSRQVHPSQNRVEGASTQSQGRMWTYTAAGVLLALQCSLPVASAFVGSSPSIGKLNGFGMSAHIAVEERTHSRRPRHFVPEACYCVRLPSGNHRTHSCSASPVHHQARGRGCTLPGKYSIFPACMNENEVRAAKKGNWSFCLGTGAMRPLATHLDIPPPPRIMLLTQSPSGASRLTEASMGRAERKPATALAGIKMEDPLMLRACRGEKVEHRARSPPVRCPSPAAGHADSSPATLRRSSTHPCG